MTKAAWTIVAGLLATAPAGQAQEEFFPRTPLSGCHEFAATAPLARPPFFDRLMKYAQVAVKHRVHGLASYYSGFFDGRKTANGEIFRNGKFSAAHLTLPLGTWIEVKSRATGRKLRMRVNDRGPYAKKFCLDLSQAAARFLGVDKSPDRHVEIRIIALPGEEPLPEDVDPSIIDTEMVVQSASASQR
jgi:rare lipoprotein A (peptidoglycan hydrolase)